MTEVDGLVLAAGAGTRFGQRPKQLADLHGWPVLEWAVRAACAATSLRRVVVVLGADADEIRAGVDLGRADAVVCERWAAGQSASLRTGLEALAGAERVLVMLGDAPLVTPEAIELIAAGPPRSRAVYGGQPGHPVLLGPDEIAAATALAGDRGARGLLRGGALIEVGHLCSGRDVDTLKDLEEISNAARPVV
ncbi:MAG: nucleotidyltransferase family protein [Solirubrobacteraceae bacterium]